MPKSLCLRCILFTLSEKEPSTNKYISIFLYWLSQLRAKAELGLTDCLQVILDTRTLEYIETLQDFNDLLFNFPCPVVFCRVSTPKTILEGMMFKYILFNYTQDIFMYCDIDIFIVKPLHTLLTDLNDRTLYAHGEGLLSDSDYGAIIPESIRNTMSHTLGFSAGKFILTSKDLYLSFFSTLQSIGKEYSDSTFYTVEQPLFNHAVHSLPQDIGEINTTLFDELVSYNGNMYSKKTIFIDLCGEPGNESVHHEKVTSIFLLLHCNALPCDDNES
jgi:hypothetical protein